MTGKNRRVLFCTVGATPQIVTETVWALMRRSPPWRPDEIQVVTTAFRLKPIRDSLQTKEGPLSQLMGDPLPLVQVHVPRRNSEEPHSITQGEAGDEPDDLLLDVNDKIEAARMGNIILRVLATITADPDADLHVSIAGGRKTMSAHALMALSLVGRPTDEASHVLVDTDYEDHPDFWHPDQGGTLQPKRGSRRTEPLDPARATVILTPTPAPLMRNRVKRPEDLAKLDLLDLMNKANLAAALEQRPHVRLITKDNSIEAHGVTIPLTPKHFAVYRLLATAQKEKWPGAGPEGVGVSQEGWLTFERIANGGADSSCTHIRDLMTQYICEAEIVAGRFTDDRSSNTQKWHKTISVSDGWDRLRNVVGNLNQDITNLKKEMSEAVGPDAAEHLAPKRASRPRVAARFGLTIDPGDIEIG